jgi:hypothetical protein
MIASSSAYTPTDTRNDSPNGVSDGHSFGRVPSDLTDDYHPLRTSTYHLDEYSNYSDDTLDPESLDMAALSKNIIGDEEIDSIRLCYLFKSNTLKLRKEPQKKYQTYGFWHCTTYTYLISKNKAHLLVKAVLLACTRE